jgi:hypothetical protein
MEEDELAPSPRVSKPQKKEDPYKLYRRPEENIILLVSKGLKD